MVKSLLSVLILLCAMWLPAAALAGGKPVPMVEIIDAPVVWPGGTPGDAAVVQRAILAALIANEWQGKLVEPGLIHAVLKDDDWVAEIDIPFTATNYSIKYSSSVNLDYNAQKHVIHRNFNKWLARLAQLIDAQTVVPL